MRDVIYLCDGTTQGDPLAMPFYVLATISFIRHLTCDIDQVWYVDDATTSGSIRALELLVLVMVTLPMLLKPDKLSNLIVFLKLNNCFPILLSRSHLKASHILVFLLVVAIILNILCWNEFSVGISSTKN